MSRTIRSGSDEWPSYLDETGTLEPIERLHVEGLPLRGGPGMVAIVGARRPTIAGVEVATRIAKGLAEAGYGVVSGMAVGIDAAAHSAALGAGGYTVGVLGCGLDIDYPRPNRGLRDRIRTGGTLVTEYDNGVGPAAFHFPARNRIIAALSEAVVFVEGSQRSGGRITMEHALEMNRATFAVPGSTRNPMAAGPNELIRRAQATLVTDVDDILDELAPGTLFDRPPDDSVRQPPRLTDDESRILLSLDDAAVTVERLAAFHDMKAGAVTLALARLEAAGYASRGFRGVSLTASGARVRSALIAASRQSSDGGEV